MPIPEDCDKTYKPNLLEFLQIGIKLVAPNAPPFFILFSHYFTDKSAVN